jgi:phosphoenolpyruvate carboxylase
VAAASKLTPNQAVGVTRTFSIMLNLVNAAEVHHRFRRLRQNERLMFQQSGVAGPLPNVEDSIRGTIDALLESGDATPQQILDQLRNQKVEIVLTAHPTQVQRKSLLRKYREVTELLGQLEQAEGYEKASVETNLERVISAIWGADEIRRLKPSPQQEAAGGNAIVESVLWEAVPAYLRKLDQQCQKSLGKPLPIDTCPIRFASWIGGDRDGKLGLPCVVCRILFHLHLHKITSRFGLIIFIILTVSISPNNTGNPNVTPEVTREVVLQQRLRVARLLQKDMNVLLNELAISSRLSPELRELAATIPHSYHNLELYRRVCGHLIQRLVRTCRDAEMELARITDPSHFKADDMNSNIEEALDVEPITSVDELMEPLRIMHKSLCETGFALVADGLLIDIIRRLSAFGLSLVPLDIREESTKHTMALDAVTRWLGIGSYKEWSEDARVAWLTSELSSQRPLFPTSDLEKMGLDEDAVKTLKIFEMASSLRPSELGAYVISQAQTTSDVLAVMLLQKQFGMTPKHCNMMRVVPLFETLDDLINAPTVLDTLFQIPLYMGAVKNRQEVMVGYSDSAKDAGRLAACWALYKSQDQMAKVAAKYSVELTFFHGKGGTVGRGGNPSVYRAIMSHPPNTINGRFRVTEQGEMISQNFGAPSIAERTLDIYTAAVLREAFTKHVEPNKTWEKQMEKIAEVSCADYRFLVREEPRFVPYFRQATPELELGSLNIGSRPAKRKPKGGIESLRAIPWTFAWAQTRTHLSAWLGVGAGLKHDSEEELATLRSMYKEWPWFRETIDLIAMIVSKTDFSISRNYDQQLVDKKDGLIKLGTEVRDKLVETRQSVLDVTESTDVAGSHIALIRASSKIRHPYVDPVNVIQAELLKRLRDMESRADSLSPEEQEDKDTIKDALILSINAIAQGMRNSG